jgi:hypothetical protein
VTDRGADGDVRLAARPLDQPSPARLAPNDPTRPIILERHREAMARGEDGYLDPATGAFVFTAAYLAREYRCCDNGCRHCPYC